MTTETEPSIAKANLIVKNHMLTAMGVSLIPIPMLDLGAIIIIQIKMLYELSRHYKVTFFREAARSAIAGLLGGGASLFYMAPLTASLTKILPGVGTGASYISLPLLSGASTYAIGKTFIQHFESGGTFLTFNAEKVKAYFQQQLEQGKIAVEKQEK